MEFPFLPIFAISLVLQQANAALPAEIYWTSVFPNSPMPKALRNLLLPPAGNKKDLLSDMANMAKNNYEIASNNYYKKASKEELANVNGDVYFFESKLHPGGNVKLEPLTRKASKAAFLPRPVADSIPFSTQKFAEILKYFSLEPNSVESNLLRQTIEDCERPAAEGEKKYCATSLESLVDWSVSTLGKNIQLLSTELEKETQNKEFTIGVGVKMTGESDTVCHKMKYTYAVFSCHSLDKTAVYRVPLVGADGTKATALAVCHKDTSTWNPKHLAFQILKVKPGTVPICHFLARETLAWVFK